MGELNGKNTSYPDLYFKQYGPNSFNVDVNAEQLKYSPDTLYLISSAQQEIACVTESHVYLTIKDILFQRNSGMVASRYMSCHWYFHKY